jgi:hypothetical protein
MDDPSLLLDNSGLGAISPIFSSDISNGPSLVEAKPLRDPALGRVSDIIAGPDAEREAAEAPVGDIVAQLGPKGLPKRKSLAGLFGLAFKRSIDRLRPAASRSSLMTDEGTRRLPPSSINNDTLRCLAELAESAESIDEAVTNAGPRAFVAVVPVASGPLANRKSRSQCKLAWGACGQCTHTQPTYEGSPLLRTSYPLWSLSTSRPLRLLLRIMAHLLHLHHLPLSMAARHQSAAFDRRCLPAESLHPVR